MFSDNGEYFVLVAEDDPDDRLLYEEALPETEFNVAYHISSNGLELMTFLREKGNPRPGIILTDLRLPGMDAHEILSAMKGDPQLEMIPVIVLTGSGQEEEERRLYTEGAKGYVVKPNAFKALVDTLNEIFRHWLGAVKLPR